MDNSEPHLRDRFVGSLLGQAIGDALGGLFEAQSPEGIRSRFANAAQLFDYPGEELYYTDDTQMMIGVAETLVEHGEIVELALCRRFVNNYVPTRGYGRGTRAVLEAIEEGRDYREVAATYSPGGSLGNGAAMRVAPVGLLFRDDPALLWQQARLSAMPTHVHPLGIEGAQFLALAVGLASRCEAWDREAFFDELCAACESSHYREQLAAARRVTSPEGLAAIGNKIEALYSVPTAIASFALTPHSFEETIANVIFLGGDTDTMAAMAGALSGAFLSATKLPPRLLALLENGPQGRDYLRQLAERLVAS